MNYNNSLGLLPQFISSKGKKRLDKSKNKLAATFVWSLGKRKPSGVSVRRWMTRFPQTNKPARPINYLNAIIRLTLSRLTEIPDMFCWDFGKPSSSAFFSVFAKTDFCFAVGKLSKPGQSGKFASYIYSLEPYLINHRCN